MNQSEKQIDQILKRGVAEIIVEEDFKKLLLSGRKLRLKEGFDPSSPDIHLGHMVALRKLRQLQDLGHQVVLIVGDWTAQIGDPSGASVTRPMLSAEQVKANAKTYLEQFFKIVDKDKTEVRWQSEWYGNFKLEDVVRLSSKFTVAQMLARDDFAKRYAAGKPISVTELLYPMLQAYDSVMVKSDVEFGGTDQKFNLLVGRELQEMVGQKPQQVLMVPILVGTDGVHKMSKSLGNYIGVAEDPSDIFGKCMSIPDELILQYFELVTDIPDQEIADFKAQMENGQVNPMILKKRLASELITQLYNATAAQEADARFTRVVQRGEIPEDMPECRLENGQNTGVIDFIILSGLAKSKSEARRLLEQGAVEINSEKISDQNTPVKCGDIIKAGKRRYSKAI
ncbi:tyrosine--tRNA ligase [Dehalococcoides mccartyi]|jgi:tyrosyl-tRNA synthetase (EC 6.1.1.1)|uniref:tyrosine--tRNA ligase n=1 Tax=Dehalococcoides mccartyi TaxID=61435 RepID=UPI00099B2B35|nr:tyrosine--tRNA ligase [Dehalococcoides mccartyi]AQX74413.1 tyrosine--tRNA ligase [Dehalococcoides mccartyi]AQY72990.1 tyrosine--tRNA ligase [Dehalococcoides mccartyi]